MKKKLTVPKDAFTIRMNPDLYDKMQNKLKVS